ncbi:MAG: SDR family NAD(P)-dependent oxidoreductase [Labilithrix sp.]|nr:SDR family NAD(P)-dependent oxidoreductase [Labilithrix sp.]MCW5816418.1 SDR family NAD(P)-dependent oxidoreductase [Labilithrix sp.]
MRSEANHDVSEDRTPPSGPTTPRTDATTPPTEHLEPHPDASATPPTERLESHADIAVTRANDDAPASAPEVGTRAATAGPLEARRYPVEARVDDAEVQRPAGRVEARVDDAEVQRPVGRVEARVDDGEVQRPAGPAEARVGDAEVQRPAERSEVRVDEVEVLRVVELLEACVDDRTVLAAIPTELRVRLLTAAGRLSRPGRDEWRSMARALRKKERRTAREEDREAIAQTEIRSARRAEVFVAPARVVLSSEPHPHPSPNSSAGPGPAAEAPRELSKSRNCYVCKDEYTRLHHFYDSMCPPCAELNYEKRFQTASLAGRTALITGARIKIGYQAALMMLRAGARVLVTTRFPRDAAERFAREPDFASFRDRLAVFGLDLRHSPSVETFARFITQTESRLDILINNAAQTVRRPAGFYAHLLALETAPFASLSPAVQSVLRRHEEAASAIDEAPMPSSFLEWRGGADAAGIRSSALLSQLPCAYGDSEADKRAFPLGRRDADLQQIDLRTMNSWRLALADVPSPELIEVQLVNAIAPFILASKLKPLMMRDVTNDKHVVNVSAMEGQFSRRTKTDKHPHTNMAKAALNMMTLTSAPDYAKSGIFMNAVDTGWVTDEDPIVHSQRKQAEHDFQPPLDIVDGAARVCDPFFHGLLTGEHVWGKFLKDYRSVPW